jgi:hypothetical protein
MGGDEGKLKGRSSLFGARDAIAPDHGLKLYKQMSKTRV